jgi:hypothetical protein
MKIFPGTISVGGDLAVVDFKRGIIPEQALVKVSKCLQFEY